MYNDIIEAEIERIDTLQDPPEEEPQRQYYFIKKTRVLIKDLEKKYGRKLTACTVNMGCQMLTENRMQETA